MEDVHLTAREAELVKDAWDIGVMPRYEQHAMEFFLAYELPSTLSLIQASFDLLSSCSVFAQDPEVMDRFPFLQTEEHVENNSRLQKHANIALLMVSPKISVFLNLYPDSVSCQAGDAMASLGEADTASQVRKRLRLLGRLHVKFGMQPHYFPVCLHF